MSETEASDERESLAEVVSSEASLTLASYEDLQQAIKSHEGKVVVVDVWSTSCPPCMREFPNLVALGKSHPESIACISMNLDYIGIQSKPPESYLPRVKDFLVEQEASHIMNLASIETDEEMRAHLGVYSIPAILIFGPDGELMHKLGEGNTGDDGLTYEGDVVPKVKALLADPISG